jgi:glycosyltransferase involved in cell wall biosynthesis
VKVLLDCHTAFQLAHGGAQIQIEQTKRALEASGVEVEFLRWWDDTQSGDVIHHFGRFAPVLIRLAQEKGIRVVVADLLTAQGSRSRLEIEARRFVSRTAEAFMPRGLAERMGWETYRRADACVALTKWEAWLMQRMFGAPPERVHVVPNGVEEIFLNAPPATRGPWLVCTATITERKRVLELARAAVAAQTPVWIIGKPYSETDPYYRAFLEVARAHPQFVRYEGSIADRAQMAAVYRAARGFVLFSTMESLSISALEAAAAECPLLFCDLPWARTVFGNDARYCRVSKSTAVLAPALRKFYDEAPALPPPPKPMNWVAVADQLKKIYADLCRTSR